MSGCGDTMYPQGLGCSDTMYPQGLCYGDTMYPQAWVMVIQCSHRLGVW